MPFFKALLILIEVLCGLLLVGVILLQRSKGEGLGMAFGAEMGESLFGAQASNVLVKITIWLGVIFLVNTTLLARIYSRAQVGPASLLEGAPAAVERTATPAPGSATAPAAVPTPPAAAPVLPAPSLPAVPAPVAVP